MTLIAAKMDYIDFLELAECSIQERIHVGNGSFETYRVDVETFKSEHPDIIEQYGLTESELFVMFMMLIKNYDEIQQQFFPLGISSQFAKECMFQYDSFLSKIPVSTNLTHYRLERYYKISDFERMRKAGQNFVCHHYLTASSSCAIFKKLGDGLKLYINRPLVDKESKAHEVYKIFNDSRENQINYERDTKFQIDNVDKNTKTIILTEL